MTTEKIIPNAQCKLIGKPSYPTSKKSLGSSMHWQVIKCPYCGEKHLHGAGNNPEEARAHFLGHRVSHCLDGDPGNGYYLVEVSPEA